MILIYDVDWEFGRVGEDSDTTLTPQDADSTEAMALNLQTSQVNGADADDEQYGWL